MLTTSAVRRPTRAPALADARPAPAVGELPWVERWLEDTAAELGGKPDLVERSGGHLLVVDVKTGLRQQEPTPPQMQQLLFYAILVEAVLKELPSVVTVQDASGKRHDHDVTREAVDSVRQQAADALSDLRRASTGEAALTARPTEESCAVCPFRLRCPDFLAAYKPDWKCGHVRVAQVADVSSLDQHRMVDVTVLAPSWGPAAMRLVGFPFPHEVAPGQTWAFSDFEGPGATAMARWNTLLAPLF